MAWDKRRYPVRGRFRLPPVGLREAVLHTLSQPSRMDPKRQSLVKVARQWQRDQPEQFAELVALIMPTPARQVA